MARNSVRWSQTQVTLPGLELAGKQPRVDHCPAATLSLVSYDSWSCESVGRSKNSQRVSKRTSVALEVFSNGTKFISRDTALGWSCKRARA